MILVIGFWPKYKEISGPIFTLRPPFKKKLNSSKDGWMRVLLRGNFNQDGRGDLKTYHLFPSIKPDG